MKQHAAFFKQSGWLMIANVVGGVMSLGVHFLAKKIPDSQYSIFITLMMVTVVVPGMPLQMLFAQQTASSLATRRERQLAGTLRFVCRWSFILWLIVCLVALALQGSIMKRLSLTDPASIWITLLMLWGALWTPLFFGVLQGRQDFFGMGWSAIIGGTCRLAFAALIVLAFGGNATGMLIGSFTGVAVVALISIWRTSDLWSLPKEGFNVRELLRQVFPLMLGFGVCQFMFSSDTILAKAHFGGEEMARYGAAGTLSRALLWLVLPLVAVMFPKIVHSSAKSEKTNLLGIVLLGTAILSICGGLGLWLVGPWVVKIVYTPSYVAGTTALLPWYALAMVPLTLTNVLVNDLMARGRFRVVPVLVGIVVVYCFTLPYILNHVSHKLQTVLQTIAVFNTVLFAVCAWAAFKPGPADRQPAAIPLPGG